MSQRWMVILLAIASLLMGSWQLGEAADPSWQRDVGLELVNEAALTAQQVEQLRGIFNAIPKALYPALRVVQWTEVKPSGR